MRKTAVLLTLSLILALGLTTLAFADTDYIYTNQTWYVMTKKNGDGPDQTLSAANKEYGGVIANMSDSSATAIVQLWANSPLHISDTYYCCDGTFNYNTVGRAWWYGDTTQNRSYHLHGRTEADYMTLSGWLRNYQ